MSNRRLSPSVSREYSPAPDACVHALQVLLNFRYITKMAARPTTHEPDDCDRTKSKEDSANVILPH
jgi:hypothetical protein